MSEDGKKKTVIRSFRLDEDLSNWMEEKHISIGKLINSLVREYMEKELGNSEKHDAYFCPVHGWDGCGKMEAEF